MPRPEGRFRRQRHPLCPECKYDLIATVNTRGRICPECGYEFELDELHLESKSSDWNLGTGLKQILIAYALRSLVIVPLWMLFVWLTIFQLGQFHNCLSGVLLVACGMAIGYGYARNLAEVAGFSSVLLLPIAGGACFGAIAGGLALVQIIQPIPGVLWIVYTLLTFIPACAWVLKVVMLDD